MAEEVSALKDEAFTDAEFMEQADLVHKERERMRDYALDRYAKNDDGESYPFDLFERKVRKLSVLKPWRILSIIFVADFERAVYEMKSPTPEKLKIWMLM